MKTSPQRPPRNLGMSLLELLVVLFIIFVLVGLLLPRRPSHKRTAVMARCINNQKQITLATIMWMRDQGMSLPPWRIPQSQGGTQPQTGDKEAKVWLEFSAIQRDLPDPKVLACPSDEKRKRNHARNWAEDPKGGLAAPKYRDQSVSYFINLDCGTIMGPQGPITSWAYAPDHVLIGDRNLRVDARGVDCSARIKNAAQVRLGTEEGAWGNTGWTNAVHGLKGVLGFNDGSVRRTQQFELETYLSRSNDRGSVHLLFP